MKDETMSLENLRAQRMESLSHFGEKYPHSFDISCQISDLDETMLDKSVSIAGRIVLLRPMGKSCFLTLEDSTGRFQAFFQQNILGEESMNLTKKFDLGDIIGIEGQIFKTKVGELTVRVQKYTLLSKCLIPPPDKHCGLHDVETRYRQRYLDLMSNGRDIFIKRSQIVNAIRQYLLRNDYIEVETPILQPLYGGALARPFTTYHNELESDLFMRIAPELYLKRLLVGGFEKVFEIGRNFRNEGVSTRHNPEFTMLEFYTAYKDYRHGIEMIRNLFEFISQSVPSLVSFSFEERSLIDLVSSFLNKEIRWNTPVEELRNLSNSTSDTSEGIIMEIYEKYIEHTLNGVFVIGFPKSVSPLAKSTKEDKNIAERFELIINGIEVVNGYSELNDPVEQLKFFENQETLPEMDRQIDIDYITALEYGMPPASGVGIGIDRIVMLLTGAVSIKDVILFPAMKRS